MKKMIFALFVSVFFFVEISAQTLSPAQQKIKTDIFTFLKKEVSNLSDYSYNELTFTYNQIKYYIELSEKDINPYFITLSAGFNLPESYKSEVVAFFTRDINLINGVKCISEDKWIRFDSEMYIKDSKAFTQVFHKMISQIEAAKKYFEDTYETAESKYNSSLGSMFNNTGFYSQNQKEFLFPAITNKGNDSKLSITKVRLEKNYTIVDFISFNNRQTKNCAINKNSYLLVEGKKYQLLKAEGISYIPTPTDYPNYQSGSDVSLSFSLFFSPIPDNTKTFDFIEPAYTAFDEDKWSGDGWQLHGVKLDNSGWINVNSEIISTAYHNWQCLALQLQDGQTVLKKKVTPKETGTYLYSDNDEFIEDADTGRKYYLRNSSISFKSSPLITYDTNPIEFAEVYPALPNSVKRINISSGSQYYIKNLQIR